MLEKLNAQVAETGSFYTIDILPDAVALTLHTKTGTLSRTFSTLPELLATMAAMVH